MFQFAGVSCSVFTLRPHRSCFQISVVPRVATFSLFPTTLMLPGTVCAPLFHPSRDYSFLRERFLRLLWIMLLSHCLHYLSLSPLFSWQERGAFYYYSLHLTNQCIKKKKGWASRENTKASITLNSARQKIWQVFVWLAKSGEKWRQKVIMIVSSGESKHLFVGCCL